MKNLIYTVANRKYYPVLSLFLTCIRKFNLNIDVCCIVDKKEKEYYINYSFENAFFYGVENFNALYETRYLINDWEHAHKYDNFLYLDCDHVCIKSLNPIFKVINENPAVINAVQDSENLKGNDFEHQFTGNLSYLEKTFNSGCFGFNKKLVHTFQSNSEFSKFIDINSQYCLTDQPLFNEFFIPLKMLNPTLNPYVYLDCNCEEHRQQNSLKNIENISLIHILQGTGEIKTKMFKFLDVMEQEGIK